MDPQNKPQTSIWPGSKIHPEQSIPNYSDKVIPPFSIFNYLNNSPTLKECFSSY